MLGIRRFAVLNQRCRKQRWYQRVPPIAFGLLLCWAYGVVGQPLGSGQGEEGGWRGALATRAGETLKAEDPDRLFVPGSVLKLVVTAAAMHHLGPDSRIVTELVSQGKITDGTLEGDLILSAAGDPTWSERFDASGAGRSALRDLARQVRQRGIARINGDLILDRSRFPGRPYPAGRPISEAAFAYAAPTSALAIDENRIFVDIAPGERVGERASVRGEPPWKFVNRTRTADRDRDEKGTIEFFPFWDSRTVLVRGEYPISEPPYRVPISVPWPDLHAAEALRQILQDAGIRIEGKIRLSDQKPRVGSGFASSSTASTVAASTVVASIASPPLVERLPIILEDSHNWHAEMLLLQLALQVRGSARLSDGLEAETEFLHEVVGIDPESFVLDDGSGLSPYNLLSPRAVTQLLAWIWQQPWRDAFVQALPTSGKGTLRSWGRLPSLRAKTGTIRHSLGLAGYLLSASGEPTIFAHFFNQRTDDRSVQRAEIAAWLRQLPR